MRRYLKYIVLTLLLVGGAILCVTRWQAWFGIPQAPEWQGEKMNFRFTTFAADSLPGWHHDAYGWHELLTPDTLEMIILGDVHSGLTRTDYLTLTTRHPHLDCYAQLGDWIDRGQTYYIEQLKHALDSTPLATLPVLYCPGNHEYTKGLNAHISAEWDSLMPHPNNGPLGLEGTTYYVDMPGIRYICIDTQRLRHLYQLTRLNCWLERVLQTRGQRYAVVMMHHPILGTSRSRFNAGVWAACAYPCLNRADVVFSGHDHSCARHMPLVALSSTTRRHTPTWYWLDEWHLDTPTAAYSHLYLTHDTLHVETRSIATGLVLDSVIVTTPRLTE